MSPTVVIGFYGTNLDQGGRKRWERWRPTLSIVQHDDFVVDRLELLVAPQWIRRAEELIEDIGTVSPETEVVLVPFPMADPWDFEGVFSALYDYAQGREGLADENLLVHITTGTHVAQICLFLLTEARYLAGRLLQTSPVDRTGHRPTGLDFIDLDVSRYEQIARRHQVERQEATTFLKQGIETKNGDFNRLIEQIERVCLASDAPILLSGPTGAGKSHLASKITELKRLRGRVRGPLVEVNCATLRGNQAMSTLFGHEKGAFTGAMRARQGLLRAAHGGMLFLDEIGELGLDEQAMLLRAIEQKRFMPMGADREVSSDFQLLAGTNRDLQKEVAAGHFREDLFARINLWHFDLPGLAERREDIAPNLDFELQRVSQSLGRSVVMNAPARRRFMDFALDRKSRWAGNFRDLNAAVIRMGTLAPRGRIGQQEVEDECQRLGKSWGGTVPSDGLETLLGAGAEALDIFDRVQLAEVVKICRDSASLSEAGRHLFAVSRTRRKSVNDADRLRKYLARFDLTWEVLRG